MNPSDCERKACSTRVSPTLFDINDCRLFLTKQIQTEPVQQRFVRLNITEAYSVIPGGPDLHVKQGSSLRLECQLMAATESPSYMFWFRGERMINYDNEPGVRVELKRDGSSVLVVEKVKPSHGANYTCSPSNARPSYIMIHVIEGGRLITRAHVIINARFVRGLIVNGGQIEGGGKGIIRRKFAMEI